MLQKIADRNSLGLCAAQESTSKLLDNEARAEADDLGLCTRVGSRVGFDAIIEDRNLVINRRGAAEAAGGLLLPTIEIVGGRNVLPYSVEMNERPRDAGPHPRRGQGADFLSAPFRRRRLRSAAAGAEFVRLQVFAGRVDVDFPARRLTRVGLTN